MTVRPTHDQSDIVLASIWLLHFRELNLILAEPAFEESWKFTAGIVASSSKAAPCPRSVACTKNQASPIAGDGQLREPEPPSASARSYMHQENSPVTSF